jgi:hypothetical protein
MPLKKKTRKRKIGGPTLKERQATGGSQAMRRKAKFAAMKETQGPRAGLTKAVGRHGGSAKTDEQRRLEAVAVAIGGRRRIQ